MTTSAYLYKFHTLYRMILSDPVLLYRHIVAFIKSRFSSAPFLDNNELFIQVINGVRFAIDAAKYPKVAKDVFCGTYETTLLHQLPRFITRGSICIDVGANVGVVTVYMAGLSGEEGEVHAFEPVPEYHENVKKIRDLNPSFRIIANSIALGDSTETRNIFCTRSEGIGVNSFIRDFIDESQWKGSVAVNIITLSDYLKHNSISHIDLLKIDAEGWGLPVLRGAQEFLRTTKRRPVIILEVSEQTFSVPGLSLLETQELISQLGYVAYKHNDLSRSIDVTKVEKQSDLILLPR